MYQAYKAEHEFDKGEKGHHDQVGHKKGYEESGGEKKKHHEEGGHYGEHHEGEKGEKEAKFEEEGKHQKGHSTKGEHNIFKKDEYEKKHDFYDEFHEEGDDEHEGGYHKKHEGSKGGHHKKGHHDSDHHEVSIFFLSIHYKIFVEYQKFISLYIHFIHSIITVRRKNTKRDITMLTKKVTKQAMGMKLITSTMRNMERRTDLQLARNGSSKRANVKYNRHNPQFITINISFIFIFFSNMILQLFYDLFLNSRNVYSSFNFSHDLSF